VLEAKSFARSARILLQRLPRSTFSEDYDPLYFLCAHSIELSLKAYLRWTGVPTRELRMKQYGHNLDVLLALCLREGLQLPSNEAVACTELIGLLNGNNVDHGLRY
jgi:hypothetical protein